jgi:hypothetical protein
MNTHQNFKRAKSDATLIAKEKKVRK